MANLDITDAIRVKGVMINHNTIVYVAHTLTVNAAMRHKNFDVHFAAYVSQGPIKLTQNLMRGHFARNKQAKGMPVIQEYILYPDLTSRHSKTG